MTFEELKALVFVIRNVFDPALMRGKVVRPQFIKSTASTSWSQPGTSPTRKTLITNVVNSDIDLNVTRSLNCTRTTRSLCLSEKQDFDLFHRMLLAFNSCKQHDLYDQRSVLHFHR